MKQRRLQVFRFLGKEFIDLRLIFGDKAACMFFDRMHFCIINYFVLPLAPIPRVWIGRTIDDVTTVCPPAAGHLTRRFVSNYREQLSCLNIGAAPDDPQRKKAFDASKEGQVLGIWFNTNRMTWQLPSPKLEVLLNLLYNASTRNALLSLNDVEVLHGKLSHISQICPPLSLFTGELLVFL